MQLAIRQASKQASNNTQYKIMSSRVLPHRYRRRCVFSYFKIVQLQLLIIERKQTTRFSFCSRFSFFPLCSYSRKSDFVVVVVVFGDSVRW